MSEPRYFRLNAECFLSAGRRRSVVHNLYTGQAVWCSEADSRVLAACEQNRPVAGEVALLDDLANRGWGAFAPRPRFVDKLRNYNVFREKRLWKETPFVTQAVLQVSDRCPPGCDACAGAFCPVCRRYRQSGESLSREEWSGLIAELAEFGCQQILFTGGEALLNPDLPRLVAAAGEQGIGIQVHASGRVAPGPELPPEVPFSLLLTDAAQLPEMARHFAGRRTVTVLNQGVDAAAVAAALDPAWAVMPVRAEAPTIRRDTLVETGFDRFFARRQTDSCLHGRLYVGHDGAVHPCFGAPAELIAELRRDGLSGAVRVLVDDWWNVPLDRVDPDRPCSVCELRHGCNACRFLDPAASCTYDVEAGAWR